VPSLSAQVDFRYLEHIVVSLLAQSGNVPKANALTSWRKSLNVNELDHKSTAPSSLSFGEFAGVRIPSLFLLIAVAGWMNDQQSHATPVQRAEDR
jgi:hypothetical protein